MADQKVVRVLIRMGLDEDAAKRVARELDQVSNKAKKAGKETEDSSKKANKGLKLWSDRVKKLAVQFAVLAGAVKVAFDLILGAIDNARIKYAFYRLTANAKQSGEEILQAMREASNGTVNDMELMRQANTALQLKVAKTPEEFRKLAESAITLGRAVGEGPVESINLLINAAGRRSTEVLDNLGISLAEVNDEMAKFAQQEFGKPVTQLTKAEAQAAFMAATIEVANRKAAAMGGTFEDLGTTIERQKASWENLKTESGTVLAVIVKIFDILFRDLTGGISLMDRLTEGTKAWVFTLTTALAWVQAIGDQMSYWIGKTQELLSGDLSLSGFLAEREGTSDRAEKFFANRFAAVQEQFRDVLNPEDVQATPITDVSQVMEDGADTAEDYTTALADAKEAIQDLGDSAAKAAAKEILRTSRDAMKAAEDAARKREDIYRKHARKLEDIAQDLAYDLADAEQKAAQDAIDEQKRAAEEKADIEREYGRKIRDIRLSFERSAEEAIRQQDAIAYLRALRNKEDQLQDASQQRKDDLADAETTHSRNVESQKVALDRSLSDVRENNRRKLEERQKALQQELEDQAIAEARKRQDLALAHTQRLQDLRIANTQRMAEIRKQLAEEVAAFKKAEAEKTAAVIQGMIDRARGLGFSSPRGLATGGSRTSSATVNNSFNFPGGVSPQEVQAMVRTETEKALNDYARG